MLTTLCPDQVRWFQFAIQSSQCEPGYSFLLDNVPKLRDTRAVEVISDPKCLADPQSSALHES